MPRRRRCLLIIPTPIPPTELVRIVGSLGQTFDGAEVRSGPDQLEVWAFGTWGGGLELLPATVEAFTNSDGDYFAPSPPEPAQGP